MQKEDYKIGNRFFTHVGEWLCTDIGRRTIAAVRYADFLAAGDNKPPYSVAEVSFDEYEMGGCWRAQDLEGVDLESFEVLEVKDLNVFTRDKNAVYKNDERLFLKGDIRSFVYLENGYYKDDSYVYYRDSIVEGADLESFEVLKNYYARDKEKLYAFGYVFDGVDADSFEFIEEGMFKDKDYLYFGSERCDDINVKEFTSLGHNLGRTIESLLYFDKRHWQTKKMQEVDLDSLRIVGASYFRDKDYEYVLKDDAWLKQEHDSSNLRKYLAYNYPKFMKDLKLLLFEADLMNIAYEDNADEYALERDEILLSWKKNLSQDEVVKLLKSVYKKCFEGASAKIKEADYVQLAQKISKLWDSSAEKEYLLGIG